MSYFLLSVVFWLLFLKLSFLVDTRCGKMKVISSIKKCRTLQLIYIKPLFNYHVFT